VTFAATALLPQRRAASAFVALALALAMLVVVAYAPRHTTTSPSQKIHFLYDAAITSTADDTSGSMFNIAREVNAPVFWSSGVYGSGVDVALIDSGVAPVTGLDRNGKIVYGPDVSYESGADNLRNLDTYGHGTNMAGIIAGRTSGFRGIAPGARIVSLKAADSHGRTDTNQIIASIRWVTEHAHSGGLNIRVLNLSFGATVSSGYRSDDLAYAVEQAWAAGIVTVVSAGNDGAYSNGLDDPAYDPYVIAVGADNPHGTTDTSDDNVTSFSSRGDGQRDPDVIAPGKSIISLRVPGSYLDSTFPSARVGDNFFRGSGTSQAAAVVSGAAALIVDQNPRLSPDQVKALLMSSARPIAGATYSAQGAGLIDLRGAFYGDAGNAVQDWPASAGSTADAWSSVPNADGNSWSQATADGNSWTGNSWTGNSWTGCGWADETAPDGNSWSSGVWEGVSWGKKKGHGG
jgi:serine protease AprX